MAEVYMKGHSPAKQLAVLFGAAGIGTRGGWGADWKPPAGQVDHRLLRPAWSHQRNQPVRGLMRCPVMPPSKPPQPPCSSQGAPQPAASEPGPSTPTPAKRNKRTEAEQAAEPTQPTKGKGKAKGKAAEAKPAPQPGRWLDRDCNTALNMQHIGESRLARAKPRWAPYSTSAAQRFVVSCGDTAGSTQCLVLWDIENVPLFKPLLTAPVQVLRIKEFLHSAGCKSVSVQAAASQRTVELWQRTGLLSLLHVSGLGITTVSNASDAADQALINHAYSFIQCYSFAPVVKLQGVSGGSLDTTGPQRTSHSRALSCQQRQEQGHLLRFHQLGGSSLGGRGGGSRSRCTATQLGRAATVAVADLTVPAASGVGRCNTSGTWGQRLHGRLAPPCLVCVSGDKRFAGIMQYARSRGVCTLAISPSRHIRGKAALALAHSTATLPSHALGSVASACDYVAQWEAAPAPLMLHERQWLTQCHAAAAQAVAATARADVGVLRTKAEPGAEPTKGKGKSAKAKPAPQPGRWLDRDFNAVLNMQRIGESRWQPLELCYWPEQGKLPAKGKEYPGLGYKRLRDKQPTTQPAAAQ
ncbi:hypothetical protein QJQ45_004053 [Haematococcus lacustris]|nr:hypothetical protein QJQ45_004053 [Haematococcus lacustris]